MTFWNYHMILSAGEEQDLLTQSSIPLPLHGVPDMSRVLTLQSCYGLMNLLHPEMPPESLQREADKVWMIYRGIQPEDTIAIFLPVAQQVAIARVVAGYHYQIEADGRDMHMIDVVWYPSIELRRFGKHKAMFIGGGEGIYEIKNREERQAIIDRLPIASNRFAKFKWVIGALMLARLASYLLENH